MNYLNCWIKMIIKRLPSSSRLDLLDEEVKLSEQSYKKKPKVALSHMEGQILMAILSPPFNSKIE